MPTTYKNAQVQGTSAVSTYATLYGPVPAATAGIVSTISVCNTAASQATFRIAISAAAGTPSASEWIAYDTTIAANDTALITAGLTMNAGQYIRVSSSSTTVTFLASLVEVS